MPNCRFCGALLRLTFADLGKTPLANSYVRKEDLNHVEPFYPLHARVCEVCFLVQVESVVPAEEIFGHYAYFSSYSKSWLEHAADYCRTVQKKFALGKESFVIEIASNDGYLLKNFIASRIPCLGVEPAANVAEVARRNNVPTETLFFGEKTAGEIATKYKKADLIIANNVLAHVPDLNDFVKGFKILLKPGGTITVEVPHLLKLIEGAQFDTIYHEHYSYFSLLALEKIFAAHGLQIYDTDELSTHGGSLRIYAAHDNEGRKISAQLKKIQADEKAANLDNSTGYSGFDAKVKNICTEFLSFLKKAKAEGKTVVGFGAAAKGNTLLNVSGVKNDLIKFVCDNNPHKQGLYLPGSHIPILSPQEIFAKKPNYILILPWNIAAEISAEIRGTKSWDGEFATAIPHLKTWQ